jgi:hypothetical protein
MNEPETAELQIESPEATDPAKLGAEFRARYDAACDLLREKKQSDSVRLAELPRASVAPAGA